MQGYYFLMLRPDTDLKRANDSSNSQENSLLRRLFTTLRRLPTTLRRLYRNVGSLRSLAQSDCLGASGAQSAACFFNHIYVFPIPQVARHKSPVYRRFKRVVPRKCHGSFPRAGGQKCTSFQPPVLLHPRALGGLRRGQSGGDLFSVYRFHFKSHEETPCESAHKVKLFVSRIIQRINEKVGQRTPDPFFFVIIRLF